MKENIVKTIELENNHALEIHDLSRKIAADAWVVIMAARMKINIGPALFTDPLADGELDRIREHLGDHIVYEYKVERNMIMAAEKDDSFENLTQAFLDNTGRYVGNSKFPGKLVLKEYRERLEKRNAYR